MCSQIHIIKRYVIGIEGPNLIVMVQIPKNYEKVIEEICAYTNGSGIVYEKKNLLLQISKTKIIKLSAAIINISFF